MAIEQGQLRTRHAAVPESAHATERAPGRDGGVTDEVLRARGLAGTEAGKEVGPGRVGPSVTVRALWHGTVLAESDETIIVEGNHYFPADAVNHDYLVASRAHTHCPWKGDASYYSVQVDGAVNDDAAWYYPEPYPAAQPIRDWVAFWRGVQVTAEPGDGRPGPTPPRR